LGLFCHLLFSTTSVALFLALFFPQLRVFNNFPALFSGLFRFVFSGQTFIFNNFSALFLKKGILFCFPGNTTIYRFQWFQQLMDNKQSIQIAHFPDERPARRDIIKASIVA